MSKENEEVIQEYRKNLNRALIESQLKVAFMKHKVEIEEDDERKKELQVLADQSEAAYENNKEFLDFINEQ